MYKAAAEICRASLLSDLASFSTFLMLFVSAEYVAGEGEEML